MKNRVAVMHGVNLDVLGRRDPEHYGRTTLPQLEVQVRRLAREIGLEATFSQTNHEGEFCEGLHAAAETSDALILNPGAWTHYSYAIRDALEVAGLPAVEVHLSDTSSREGWRRRSVIRDLCIATVQGKGVSGYGDALGILREHLREAAGQTR
ncbi:MAG: type II 3-dehydroquinate dehydratase [Thermoleophilaceae bacterium]